MSSKPHTLGKETPNTRRQKKTQDKREAESLNQRSDAPLVLNLPEEPPGAEPLQYVLEGYTRDRLLGGAPWQPQSREADFEKTLQLQLPHQIIEAAALHVMTRRRAGTSFAGKDDAKIESEWKLATRIHRLATHEPRWEILLAEEYLRLQREYTSLQIQQMRTEHKEPTTRVGPEPVLDRTDVIDQIITTEEQVGRVTFFSRMVLRGWRQATVNKKAKRIRDMLQPGAVPSPIPQHSAAPNELPSLIPLTKCAQDELSRRVAAELQGRQEIAAVDKDTPSWDCEKDNKMLFDRVCAEAQRRARQKGSSTVSYRDIRESAQVMDTSFGNKKVKSPSEEQPEHIDEVVESLAAILAETLRLSRGGIAPPRVLVIGETGSEDSPPIVAKMFRDAGADVATCDLKKSTYPGIPHHEGEASDIQDQGWDLVINHPPCTYLSNAGITWLKDDPTRWKQMVQNASVFRQMHAAQAPFVASENSKMHRHARAAIGNLRPTQYIHPWQHGHGHTKAIGLFLKNLPPLIPSKLVTGRSNVLARLGPGEDRASRRSKTYTGIAAAMASQWMPTLHQYTKTPSAKRNGLTASEMVTRAQVKPTTRLQIAFVSQVEGLRVLTKGNDPELPMGTVEDNTGLSEELRSMVEKLQIPEEWVNLLREQHAAYPEGERCFYEIPEGRFARRPPTLTRVWIVDVSGAPDASQTTTGSPPPPEMKWTSLDAIKTPFIEKDSPLSLRYRQELREAASKALLGPMQAGMPKLVGAITGKQLPNTRQPWLVDYEDLPPPPPSPRHIRRLKGKWRIWTARDRDDQGKVQIPVYNWELLPAEIAEPIEAYLGLPVHRMTTTEEGKVTEIRSSASRLAEELAGKQEPTEPPSQSSDACLIRRQTGTSQRLSTQQANTNAMDLTSLKAVNWSTEPDSWYRAQGGLRIPTLTQRSKQLWTARPWIGQIGLGAEANRPPKARKPYPKQPADRIAFIKSEHRKFRIGSKVPETEWKDQSREPTAGQTVCCAERQDPEAMTRQYQDWLTNYAEEKMPRTVASLTRSTDSDSVMDLDPTVTPNLGTYMAQALYVNDFSVARRAQTRNTKDDTYTVHNAIMPIDRVLADTGAAPSIITTEMLEKLPGDCRLSRDRHAPVGRLNGADGQPLITYGNIKLDFKLGDTACQHVFTVVEGKPLVLLGNDFLVPRQANIALNTDGKGNGKITLTSLTRKGDKRTHSFDVSGNAKRSDDAKAVTCQPGRTVANVSSLYTPSNVWAAPQSTEKNREGSNVEPLADWYYQTAAELTNEAAPKTERLMPEPLKPAEMVAEAFDDHHWNMESSEHLLYTGEAVVVPSRSRVTIRVRAPRALLDLKGVPSCLVDRLPQIAGMEVPAVVTRIATIEDGQVEVQIVNPSKRKLMIAGNSPLAMLDSDYYVRGCLDPKAAEATKQDQPDPIAVLSEQQLKMLNDVIIDPDHRLTEEQKLRVKRLVAENISAFATDPKNPTKTHLIEVELPLKPDAMPHRHAASRLGEEGRQLIEKHVEEMESRGIIRKSNSAWGSRVVLVTKKDGSIRFCVDYRDLNSKLKLQDSPIPLTVEALDRLSSGEGCQTSLFLSTLDLASGFWTLPIKESDKGLTAFVTHRQKYEFNYLPFGVQSGPSYMCRLMDAALQGLAWETCMPYLDDVGIWSTGSGDSPEARELASFDQMMTRLQAVFKRLRWAGLSMKANKCILFATKAEYLGHVVSRKGLCMDPKKIATVAAFDPTTINTVFKIRSFLGICSYYRRFIEGFSQIATPLTDLTKDGVDVEKESQSPACQRAMRILIKAITQEPVLSAPKFDRPFIVKTDAANKEGLGGVLSQLDDDGRERVVAYHGRRLNKHERNYTVTEIELLAAVDSIKHWRPYLWGRSFKLVIDHSALRWLHTMRDTMEGGPASRLMRWILKLSEYRFHVEHKPGLLHKDADGISRLVAVTTTDGREQVTALLGDDEEDAARAIPELVAKAETISAALQWGERPPVPRKRTTTARSRQAAKRSDSTTAEVDRGYLRTGAPTADQISQEQNTDPECVEIMDYLNGTLDEISSSEDLKRLARLVRTTTSGTHNQKRAVATAGDGSSDQAESSIKIIRRICEDEGTLYRVTRHEGTEAKDQRVPFVPSQLRQSLMTAFHDNMGHANSQRVRIAIQQRYYWPKMGKEIEEYVQRCHECTMAKPPPTRGKNPVGPTVGRYPFDLLYADILDMANTHDYTKEGKGYRKLVVFADSLSRWVEAIPVHHDPTSAEIMNIFNEHIVARYGVPRTIVSDRGSNLVGKLNNEIMKHTGVSLHGTTSEHKEANGVVERFNRTLQNMMRATNEGGRNWKDHLPWILMAYRATPHRITRETPSMILYGREMRLPAQLGTEEPPPSTLLSTNPVGPVGTPGGDTTPGEYAVRLHNRIVYAWKAAYGATRSAQAENVADTTAKAIRARHVYQIGDRVVRKLYDPANSLANKYAGPYRIDEVIGKGRYRVRDLENRLIYNEIDVSNLRPYKTVTDEEELAPDEYVVEELIDRRIIKGKKSYLAKYLGYPRNQAEWTSQTELARRCEDMIDEYDAAHPISKKGKKAAQLEREATDSAAESEESTPAPRGPEPPDPTEDAESHLPKVAKYTGGKWLYGRQTRSRRTNEAKLVWKSAEHYTPEELTSDEFQHMRKEAEPNFAKYAAYIEDEGTPSTRTLGADSAHAEQSLLERETRVVKFVLVDDSKRIFSWIRADSVDDPEGPHVDLPGGKVDPEETLLQAAHRELAEEISPYGLDLRNQVEATMNAAPNGHSQARMELSDHNYSRHHVMVWGMVVSGTKPLVSVEAQKNLVAKWRDPEEVWPSFRGPRTQYGVAVRLAWEAVNPRQSVAVTSNLAETEEPVTAPSPEAIPPASVTDWTNELWDPQPGTFYGTGESSYRIRERHASTSPYSNAFQMREEVTTQLASKIWFITNEDAMCYHRADSAPDQPQLDTYGGEVEPADNGSHAECASGKLKEDVTLPASWLRSAERAIELDPEGQSTMKIDRKDKTARYRMAVWFVRLTDREAREIPVLTIEGQRKALPHSMQWRSHGELLSNLSSFTNTLAPLIKVMKQWLLPLSAPLSTR